MASELKKMYLSQLNFRKSQPNSDIGERSI